MSRKRSYYHRTSRSAAEAILREGFRDGEGFYGFEVLLRGVWLSDVPLDINEGADGDTLLAVKLTTTRADLYEWIEKGKPYREFLCPASVLNRRARVRVLTAYEEERQARRKIKWLRASWRAFGLRLVGGLPAPPAP